MKLKNVKVLTSVILILIFILAFCGCDHAEPAQSPGPSASISKPTAAIITPRADTAAPTNADHAAASTPAGADINISKITVTFFGSAATSKGFTWYSNQKSNASDLEIIEKTGSAPDFSKSEMYTGTVSVPHNSHNELLHKAVATDLKCDTSYYYRVGDSSLNAWSIPAVLTTSPAGGAFTFIDVSDTQMANKKDADLAASIMKSAFSTLPTAGFLINNGDIVDTSSETQWDWLLGSAQAIFQNTTFMPASGNHDSGRDFFIDHFNLDTGAQDTTTGAYYSVDYGNAHFVVLNTNESSSAYAEFTNDQVAWLEKDIIGAKASGEKWVILVMHKGPYSTATHASDADVVDTREKIAPMLSRLGVDLVLQGHDHVYARSKPIAGGTGVPENISTMTGATNQVSYIVNPGGTVYITPGTAGIKHYYQKSDLPLAYLNLFDFAKGPFSGDPYLNDLETFVGFTIDGNRLTGYAYQINRVESSAKPILIDQFGIVKN